MLLRVHFRVTRLIVRIFMTDSLAMPTIGRLSPLLHTDQLCYVNPITG